MKTKAKRKSRFMAAWMTLAMIIGMIPAGAFAETPPSSTQQIDGGNAPIYYVDDEASSGTTNPLKTITGTGDAEGLSIGMSKSIEGTETENVFNITLDVETNSVVSNVVRSDAAAVVVLDISGSMVYNADSSSGGVVAYDERRLTKAVNAVNDFIEDFANATDISGNPIPGDRWVSVVVFGIDGQVLRDWVNVGNTDGNALTGSDLDFAKITYRDDGSYNFFGTHYYPGTLIGDGGKEIDVFPGGKSQGTNMSGGLSTAINQLDHEKVKDITCKNTILFTDGAPSYCTGESSKIEGYTYSNNGDDYKRTEYQAYYTRQKSNLFTVAYGSVAHSNWMRDYLASNASCHFSGGDNLDLQNVFNVINNEIGMSANAWTVTDPMGKYFKDVKILNKNNDAAVVTDNVIHWDLKQDSYDSTKVGTKKYSLTLGDVGYASDCRSRLGWGSVEISPYERANNLEIYL